MWLDVEDMQMKPQLGPFAAPKAVKAGQADIRQQMYLISRAGIVG